MSPRREVVIGIDAGTTAVKVAAFEVGTGWSYLAVREYSLLQAEPGRQEQDPVTIAAAVLDALAETVKACEGRAVLGLSVSSAMHGLLALDAAHEPLTPLVTWADSRAADEARALHDSGQARDLYRLSGTPVHPMTPQSKLMWFAQHEPGVCARARWWTGLKDYLLLTLTGRIVTELSSASATGLLHTRHRRWSDSTADLSGISVDQLPPILPTTEVLPLADGPARHTGLPPGLPVVTGAGDGPLGNLGTGAMEPGVAGLSLGTSGAVRLLVGEPTGDATGRLFCYAVTEDTWALGGAISNGGATVRWAADVFGCGSDERALALASQAPPGSDGLVMVPYLLAERSPLWDPGLPGAYLGLRRHHGPAHFVRAAVEGVCLQLSTVLTQLAAITPVRQVRATGGVFRSPLWRDTLAAVLPVPLVVTGDAGGSARGAAIVGLLGLGRAGSLPAAAGLLPDISGDPVAVHVPAQHAAIMAQAQGRLVGLATAYEPLSGVLGTY